MCCTSSILVWCLAKIGKFSSIVIKILLYRVSSKKSFKVLMAHVNKSLKAHSGLVWQWWTCEHYLHHRESHVGLKTSYFTFSHCFCWNATQHTRNICLQSRPVDRNVVCPFVRHVEMVTRLLGCIHFSFNYLKWT